MGFDIVEAHDGEDALEKLEELYDIYKEELTEKLKVIISDVEMPKDRWFPFLQTRIKMRPVSWKSQSFSTLL